MSWSKAKKLNIEKQMDMYSGPFIVGYASPIIPLIVIIITVALAVCLRKPLGSLISRLWELIQSA